MWQITFSFSITSKENYDNIVIALGCEPVEGADGFIHTVPGQAVKIDLVFESACTSAEQCTMHADFDIAGGVYSLGEFHFPEGYQLAIKRKVMRFLQTRHPASSYWRFRNC